MILKDGPCIYFISDGQGHVKIGIASNLKSRLSTLQVGSAFELSVIHAEYVDSVTEASEREREYHALFAQDYIRGEWYNQEPVERYLREGTVTRQAKYFSDHYPEFDICDALNLFVIGLESKTPEQFKERYEKEMPKTWQEAWREYEQGKCNAGHS